MSITRPKPPSEHRPEIRALLDEAFAALHRNDATAAIAASTQALEALGPEEVRSYGIAHSALGAVYFVLHGDHATAEKHYRLAVEVRPRSQ